MIDPNAKLDPTSVAQLRLIEAETALETLKKRYDTLSFLNDGLNVLIKTLDLRVSNLEQGRREQILLNQKLLNSARDLQDAVTPTPKKSLWDWLR